MLGSRHPWIRAGVSLAGFLGIVFLLVRIGSPRWILSLVQAGFTGWFIYLLGDSFNRNRGRGDPDPGRMAQPTFIVGLGLVGTVFFGALEAYCLFWPNPTVTWWVLVAFGVFTFASALLVLDGFLGRHTLSDRGMVHRNWWGRATEISWAEVTRLRWHGVWKLFRICSTQARPLWVWSTLTGQQEFARRVVEGVGPEALDGPTRGVLKDALAGNLPPAF